MARKSRLLHGILTFSVDQKSLGRYYAFYDMKSLGKNGCFKKPAYRLKNGDELTIYRTRKGGTRKKIVWSGVISLRTYRPLTKKVSDLYICAEQKNVHPRRWVKYFKEECTATLRKRIP